MKDEEVELLKEFEKAFGFATYEALKVIISRMYIKIKTLEESRDNWRSKYEELKGGKKKDE